MDSKLDATGRVEQTRRYGLEGDNRVNDAMLSRCGAVGSILGLGPRGRRFESSHLDNNQNFSTMAQEKTKKEISLKGAIEGVKSLFELVPFNKRQDGKSFYSYGKDGSVTFYFDKRQYWRDEVISKLAAYFQDKYLIDGQCRIDSITLLWTTVHLEGVDAHKKE